MKIELEVDPKDLTKSLKEILDTLPPEQRLELARKAMETWLREPYDIERKVREREVIENLKNKSNYGRPETEEEIRNSYGFRNAMQEWRSTKERMIETITKEISDQYKAAVREVLAQDQKIQAMKDEVVKIVKETFPKIFHEAMVAWTASNIQTMLESSMGVKTIAENQDKLHQAVGQRIMDLESRMASRM